jgi:hypothetical protein
MSNLKVIACFVLFILPISIMAGQNCKSVFVVDSDLWMIADDGATLKQMTDYKASPMAASWSPTGQYLAYAPGKMDGYNREKDVIILNDQAKQILKVVVEEAREDWDTRFVSKIVWINNTTLLVESSTGKYGTALDIYDLRGDLSDYEHVKRIKLYYCDMYSMSPDYTTVACLVRLQPPAGSRNFIEVHDVAKHYEEAIWAWKDPHPKRIDLGKIDVGGGDDPRKVRGWCDIKLSPSKDKVLLSTENGQYEVDIKTNEIRDLKKSPEREVSKKPEYITIKMKNDKRAKNRDVLDAFCFDKTQE